MKLNAPGFSCVYWIHKPEDTDMYTTGYIGVSSNPSRRWKEHLRDARGRYHPNNYLSSAILKYEHELIYDIIFGGTHEQCYKYEAELRPSASIGWNLMAGGVIGSPTEESRARISAAKKNKPVLLVTKWRAYQSRTRSKISLIEYKDLMAVKAGNLPPSKKGLKIFCQSEVVTYPSCIEAAQAQGLQPIDILEICDRKTDDLIYLKDL